MNFFHEDVVEVEESPPVQNPTRGRTKAAQMALLVDMMESHVALATGKSDGTNYARMHEEQWKDVAMEVNKLGPPTKDWRGWRNVWNDMTNEVRKKLRNEEKYRNGTGGGAMKRTEMSQQQSRVANFMQLRAAVQGRKGYKFGAGGMVENPEHLLPALTDPEHGVSTMPTASSVPPRVVPVAGPSTQQPGPSSVPSRAVPVAGPSTQQSGTSSVSVAGSSQRRKPRPPQRPRRNLLNPPTTSQQHRRYTTARAPLIELFENRFNRLDATLTELVKIQAERAAIEKERFVLDQENARMYRQRLNYMEAFSRGLADPDDLDE